MKRPLRVLIVSVFVFLAVAIMGVTVAAWWVARPPAPAPAGMAQRFIDEHRALLEASWPEGEPAWTMLLMAQNHLTSTAAQWSLSQPNDLGSIVQLFFRFPPETPRLQAARRFVDDLRPAMDLTLVATRSRRFYESYEDSRSLSVDPSWHDLWDIPNANSPLRLANWMGVEFLRAVSAGDTERAADAYRASLRLASYRAQRPSAIRSLSHSVHLRGGYRHALDAAREHALSAEMCEALIEVIESERAAEIAIEAPVVDATRLYTQRYAVEFREGLRTTDFLRRLEHGTQPLIDSMRKHRQGVSFGAEWLSWLRSHSAESVERIIDEHYDAVAEWWEKPFGERAPSPSVPPETAGAPFFDFPLGTWATVRGMHDIVRSREAGTVLLLRIEAHMARHGGPPKRLEDAAELDEIIDPVTGRRFEYALHEDGEAGEWPFSLYTPLTLEEYATLMGVSHLNPRTEQRWNDWTTLTLPPLDPPTPEEMEETLWMLPVTAPE